MIGYALEILSVEYALQILIVGMISYVALSLMNL